MCEQLAEVRELRIADLAQVWRERARPRPASERGRAMRRTPIG